MTFEGLELRTGRIELLLRRSVIRQRGSRDRRNNGVRRLRIGDPALDQQPSLTRVIDRLIGLLKLRLDVLHPLQVPLELGRQLARVRLAIGLELLLLLGQSPSCLFQLALQELVRRVGELRAIAGVFINHQGREPLGDFLRCLRLAADETHPERFPATGSTFTSARTAWTMSSSGMVARCSLRRSNSVTIRSNLDRLKI